MATLSLHTYYTTVAALEAVTGSAAYTFAWCDATETWHEYVASAAAYTVDHLRICATGDAGNTRFLGRMGKYIVDGQLYNEYLVPATGSLSVAQVSNAVLNNLGQTVNNAQQFPVCTQGYDGTQSTLANQFSCYVNGTFQSHANNLVSNLSLSSLFIGVQSNNSYRFNGYHEAFLLYTSTLSTQQRQYIERSYGLKYGITVV